MPISAKQVTHTAPPSVVGCGLIKTSKAWMDWLRAIGIDIDGQNVTKVILEIPCNDVVKVWIERNGDKRLLAIAPPTVTLVEPA